MHVKEVKIHQKENCFCLFKLSKSVPHWSTNFSTGNILTSLMNCICVVPCFCISMQKHGHNNDYNNWKMDSSNKSQTKQTKKERKGYNFYTFVADHSLSRFHYIPFKAALSVLFFSLLERVSKQLLYSISTLSLAG